MNLQECSISVVDVVAFIFYTEPPMSGDEKSFWIIFCVSATTQGLKTGAQRVSWIIHHNSSISCDKNEQSQVFELSNAEYFILNKQHGITYNAWDVKYKIKIQSHFHLGAINSITCERRVGTFDVFLIISR